MINPLYGVIALLGIMLLLSLYNLFEKEQEIERIKTNISALESQITFMKSENERLGAQLRDISDSIVQREAMIVQLRKQIEFQNQTISFLNYSLQNEINRSRYFEEQYRQLQARANITKEILDVVRDIEYRLKWVELNMQGSSNEYREFLREVADNCLSNATLDLACSYLVAEARMNRSPNDADDIFTALRKGSGDCLTFSLLLFRVIRDLNPPYIIYLERTTGSTHTVKINNTVYNIRDQRGIKENLRSYRIACIGINQNGHCGLLINDIMFLDYGFGIKLGTLDSNIRKCENKRCEWKDGYITMQITQDDIIYLNSSLRGLMSKIRG